MKKKLIEVALPLEAINEEGSRRKRKAPAGYPTTLHKWWAQRPIAAARAVIFAQMVDDPSGYVDTLRADPKLKRKAEAALKARLKVWEEARELARKAKGGNLAVPEPGPEPTLDEMLADSERQRLFRIIEDLVLWENTTNETVLQAAQGEIWASWRRACAQNADHPRAKELFDRKKLPAFHDPFAGGGALPLEAQRLGLESYASDLNPVAVLINKAMIEIPPKFAGKPPVNPAAREEKTLIAREWKGAQGLAEDVRYYGKWMRDEAEKRIGTLYPKVEVTAEMAKDRPDLEPYVGRQLTVIAWLWARTVKSPNPAFANVDVPLASTFMLSTKAGKEAYVEPVIEDGGYRFSVKVGKPEDAERAKRGTTAGKRSAFRCLMSGVPVTYNHIRSEGKAGQMGARLMAIVAEGQRGRVYLAPTREHEAAARKAKPEWKPELSLPDNPRDFKTPNYGLTTYGDLFTPRQLVALTTFSDLLAEAMQQVHRDALGAQTLGARASGPLSAHRGWHSRGYHPHYDAPGIIQSLTFRLHDSVPADLLERWRAELGPNEGAPVSDERQASLRERIEKYEDAGHGACWLREPRIARIVEEALLHFDGERYRLLEWCVMPNHVHVLIETLPTHALSDVVRSWKTFTAREANQLLGRGGPFWMPDYFDRYVRDEQHLDAVRRYIRENPVKARLCSAPEEWAWSSAGAERAGGPRTQDDDATPLRDGGIGAVAYAEAVGVYLALAVDKAIDYNTTLVTWSPTRDQAKSTFARQAVPMVWDYAEVNQLAKAAGDFRVSLEGVIRFIEASVFGGRGSSSQSDAAQQTVTRDKLISTDPGCDPQNLDESHLCCAGSSDAGVQVVTCLQPQWSSVWHARPVVTQRSSSFRWSSKRSAEN